MSEKQHLIAALHGSLARLKEDMASLIASHSVPDPETLEPSLESIDNNVRRELVEYDELITFIEQALNIPGQKRTGGRFPRKGTPHDPRAYGVTTTVDVLANSPQDAASAFLDEVAILKPAALTFIVQHLNTGQITEL